MKTNDLFNALVETFPGFEVFQDVIEVPEEENLPKPYAYFVTGETNPFYASGVTYFCTTPVSLFWIEDNPSEAIAEKTREMLTNMRKPYTEVSNYDDDLAAFVHEYKFYIY